ncbi:hypothetical protein TcasGA2_TC034636 [Tribolium castaneum]|uniref:Uncharacterized protein n=1 Tax=Tribolium castaneum TaxID=7070 RepID=A0A139WKF2_TRICA|nr:hypothetical protein TcasGA2_TC034636 [Tribolium castaneum]
MILPNSIMGGITPVIAHLRLQPDTFSIISQLKVRVNPPEVKNKFDSSR